jgi:hypothetical protein
MLMWRLSMLPLMSAIVADVSQSANFPAIAADVAVVATMYIDAPRARALLT